MKIISSFPLKVNSAVHLLTCLLFSVLSNAQLFSKDNFINIHPTDNEKNIIRKAANIKPSARQLKWQEKEIMGFLHFGINTFTNREWGDGKEDPSLFNPTNLDARQWVRVCKNAGMKQVILTAKHHDGFCLWPSKYTTHTVRNSPWKNGNGDLVKEVAAACKEFKIGFGVYLSPWDRNSAYFGDSALYNNYFINQLTELLTEYGKIDEVWFDGANGEGPNGKKQVYDFDRWYTLIRKLQPDAVIAVMGPDVRWVGTESGYGRETEWSVVPVNEQVQEKIIAGSQKQVGFAPANLMNDDLGSRTKLRSAKTLVWYPAEIDVSIRPGWFYHPAEDSQVKSPDKLMDIYFSSVGRNGVLLLNIPPDTRGLIHEADVKTLETWKRLRDASFAYNYLNKSAIISDNGRDIKHLVDGKTATYWTTTGNDSSAIIGFYLTSPRIVDAMMLQENIRIGQRIEKFIVEYKDGEHWEKLTEGTTVGYKRLLRFPEKEVQWIRIRIIASRLNPTIAEVGLFRLAK